MRISKPRVVFHSTSRITDGRPISQRAHADHSPSVLTGALERLFGSSLVRVLPFLVVMTQKQAQRWVRGILAKAQHGNVTVGIARGKRRSATDPPPDAHRLDGTVVEDVQFCFVGDIGDLTIVAVL